MPDSQTLGLLVAAMVAGIICFRLYTILGRRTGHEPPPQQPVPQRHPETRPAIAASKPPQDVAPSSSGLLDIQMADRKFDTPKFLGGAREAYARIVTAFAKGDRAELRPLLSPEVFTAFDAGISALSSELVFNPDGGFQRRVLASDRLTKIARLGSGSFADSRSITFSVGANDDFFVSAFLIADALFVDANSMTGVADAAHTMTASFTAGNVSLLTPVPELSTYGMLLIGLGLLSCAGWPRRS